MTEPIICKNGIAICHLIGKTLSICGSINNAYYYELPTKSVSIKNQLDNIRIIKKHKSIEYNSIGMIADILGTHTILLRVFYINNDYPDDDSEMVYFNISVKHLKEIAISILHK